MIQRLSGLDAAFLYAETPAMHMHGGALTVLDPSAAPQGLDVHRFREIMAARLDQLAPFRQRLITTPFGIDRPVWVDDHRFDVRAHIRPIAVPRPGTARQVADLAGELPAVPLPRDRPLWEMWFIEGLEHGRTGLLTKVHHAPPAPPGMSRWPRRALPGSSPRASEPPPCCLCRARSRR